MLLLATTGRGGDGSWHWPEIVTGRSLPLTVLKATLAEIVLGNDDND